MRRYRVVHRHTCRRAMRNRVRINTSRRRFELEADGYVAFSDYSRNNGVLTIVHTKVPKELEGRGIGSRLVRGELKIARELGLKVVPKCSFVKAYIDKHPEFADLLK
jgi:predicted GNAT family acetyltransferase